MITITELAADTRCSRTTIYAAIKRLEIKPHKQKRNSLLDAQQVALIKEALPSDETAKEAAPTSKHQQKKPTETTTTTNNAQDSQHLLIKQLQEEGNHLKGLLEREQAERSTERIERAEERKAERERAERHDALVTALLSEQKGLRDEVQRLKAIQGPDHVFSAFDGDSPDTDGKPAVANTSAHSATSNVVHLERPSERVERSAERTIERSVEQAAPAEFAEATPKPEAVVSNNVWGSRLTAFGLLGTTMAVITFLVTINNPDLILSKAIASLWQ